MQAVQPAIGNLGVNPGNFAFGFQPVLAAELLLSKSTLILCQFSGVFSRMAGITGFKTFRGDEQILDTHVNTHLFISNRQLRAVSNGGTVSNRR